MYQVFVEAAKEIAKEAIKNIEEMKISETLLKDIENAMAQNEVMESSLNTEISNSGFVAEEFQKIEPNATYYRHGDILYTDDNGSIYRCNNELLGDNTYEINGYTYSTDEMGRVVSAEGKARLKTHEGKLEIKDSKESISHGDAKETDDRGHIIGDQLDGSNGMENIVAQDANINQGAYKKLEDRIAKAVKEGHDVDIKVEPIYGDKLSYRPTEIKYTYTIDGEKNITLFPNGR